MIDSRTLVQIDRLRHFQNAYPSIPARDSRVESPAEALQSLVDARNAAPASYADYLNEAVTAYEQGLYRAAILMVWSSVIEHLYGVVEKRAGGIRAIEAENLKRYGPNKSYRQLRKVDDLRYLKESQFIQLGEDCGMYNRNARAVLLDRLDLRNRCGHPTGYKPGREESVVFIESLSLNFLSGTWLNW